MRKNILIITTLLCLIGFATACENKITDAKDNNELYSSTVTKIEAKVENAEKYSEVVAVKLMGYAFNTDNMLEIATGVWADGGFIIELPKTVSSNNLFSLNDRFNHPQTFYNLAELPISNKNVRVVNADFWGVDKDGNLITRFFPFEIDANWGTKGMFYTYVDSDVTISGYQNRFGFVGIEYEHWIWLGIDRMLMPPGNIITSYSIYWKKGWNLWQISRYGSGDAELSFLNEKWETGLSNNLKWYGSEDFINLNRYGETK